MEENKIQFNTVDNNVNNNIENLHIITEVVDEQFASGETNFNNIEVDGISPRVRFLMYNSLFSLPNWFPRLGPKKLFKQSKEDEELDKYIMRSQIESLFKTYIWGITFFIWFIFSLCGILNIIYYLSGLADTKSGWTFMVQVFYLMIYGIICFIIVKFYVNITPFLIPISIWVFLFITVNIGGGSEKYTITEYMLPVGLLVSILIIIVPSQWLTNSLAFNLGMVYFLCQMYSHYGVLPVPLLCSVWLSSMYYTCAAWILYNKLRNLYILLQQNQKLNKEMKRLLQIFPESVLIKFMKECENKQSGASSKSQDSTKKSGFTNQKFSSHIGDIEKSIMKLEQLKVSFTIKDEQDGSTSEEVVTNLYEFLNDQESKLQDSIILEKNNVKVWGNNEIGRYFDESPILHEQEDNDNCVRIFNIKTLQVNWEGKEDACMHVFVDTTDIRRLEEANNNIKGQKIMFASVSHEF